MELKMALILYAFFTGSRRHSYGSPSGSSSWWVKGRACELQEVELCL